MVLPGYCSFLFWLACHVVVQHANAHCMCSSAVVTSYADAPRNIDNDENMPFRNCFVQLPQNGPSHNGIASVSRQAAAFEPNMQISATAIQTSSGGADNTWCLITAYRRRSCALACVSQVPVSRSQLARRQPID